VLGFQRIWPPIKAYGQVLLGFELHITNFRATDITLNRVDVFSQDAIDQPIASYQDANLMNSIARPGAPSSLADTRAIGGGMRAVVYLWLTFDKVEAVPHSLRHRFLFTIADSGDKSEERMMEAARIHIPKEAPVVISAPLQDGNWAAGNGPSNGSIHRRALIPVSGQARIAQRLAIDWVQLGDDGKAWHGGSQENQNWYGYGAEVLAVADGVVAEVKDGIPENVPLSPTRAVPITPETVGGNHVILDLGNGKFAFYAHLQPNSIRAKVAPTPWRH
jgi:murein DD-endopeptidase